MKIQTRKEAGNVLMVTLVMGAILSVGLASYFTLVQAQNNAVLRSQSWNSAMPAAEAGLEDALTQLNQVGDGNRGTNGWTSVSNQFFATRTFSTFRYAVSFDNATAPTIYSTGYVRAPKGTSEVTRVIRVTTSRANSGMKGMVAIGNITMNGNCASDSFDSSDPTYSTGGVYDAAKKRDQSYVASVQGSIDTGGGTVAGYIATGPNGTASGNAGDFAWLASHSGIEPGHYANDLNVSFPAVTAPFSSGMTPESNAAIVTTNYSYTSSTVTTNVYPNPAPASGVTTGTQSYTTTSYPSGQANITTNLTYVSAGNSLAASKPAVGTYVGNITTNVISNGKNKGTWYEHNHIMSYNYTTAVYTYNLSSTNMVKTTNTYTYALRTGNYMASSLSMSGQDTMIVVGDAVLYTTGGFSMAGQSQIIIVPGASLKIYNNGDANFAGNGFLNQNGDTTKLSYYGMPGNTSLSLGGNASFTGSIYAPSADFSLNGGGNNNYDLVGATVTKTVSMHGHFNFHYDERLGRTGGATRYSVASWNEI